MTMPAKIEVEKIRRIPISSPRESKPEANPLTRSRSVRRTTRDSRRKVVGPEELIRKSFEFLLEREPKESILSRFDLSVISRYFPEYEREIRKQLG